ncbi:hypothetical protein ACFWBG_34415 [Nocardia salmonicida]|uniref:hypothetical protein n=1 Tax=Nocardia salmonicida TaxID=53431 RepID=UPI00366B5D37
MMNAEYASLKSEQLERIKQRDTFLNLNIVAIAAITAVAVQGQKQSAAWLVIPWVTAILGSTYLANDDKVSAIARHLKMQSPNPATSWESSGKGILSPRVRRYVDIMVFVLSFILPAPVAVALYGISYQWPWAPIAITVAAVEIALIAGLFVAFIFSIIRRS